MGEPTTVNAITQDELGRLQLRGPGGWRTPALAELEASYERPTKPKVLTRTPLDPVELFTDPNSALLRFDRLFALDTNSRQLHGALVSVTGIVLGIPSAFLFPPSLRYAAVHALEHRDADCSPEKLGWRRGIELILANPNLNSANVIGLIVDAHLSELASINSRSQPILDDFFLPPQFHLIYASGDSGQEFAPNRLIRLADSAATQLLDEISQNDQYQGISAPLPDKHSSYFRVWTCQ